MREKVIKRILKAIEANRHEFPCGFEIMAKEEGFALPEQYNGMVENPDWIIEVTKIIPRLSDELLLQTWEQFLCLEFR